MLTSPSGKSYIGQTTRTIEERFEEHVKHTSRCFAIKSAIQKYGWENIGKDWYECPDEDLDFDETFLISKMNTLAPNGYNLRKGGIRGKMSASTRDKMSLSQLGSKNHRYGKTPSLETRMKTSLSSKGKRAGVKNAMYGIRGKNHPRSKKICQYSSDNIFMRYHDSIADAERLFRSENRTTRTNNIGACLINKQKTAYNFIWKYAI
jgi:group I intron endonuclease